MSAEELVDIIDEDDRAVRRVTRREMRQRRLRHRCTYVLLFDSTRRIFVHRRTSTKDVYPGIWDVAIGGVVAAGEDYDRGAYREVEEEVGLRGVVLTRLFPMAYEDEFTLVRGMVYECICDGPLRLQNEEIAEGRWIYHRDLAELTASEPFCPDGLAVLERYLRGRTFAGQERARG